MGLTHPIRHAHLMKAPELCAHSFDALIFDCDGTLVNSAPLHFEAFRCVLAQLSYHLSRHWYNERLGLSRVELLGEFKLQHHADFDVPKAVVETELHYLNMAPNVKPIPEVVEIVHRFHGKVPMAVASSGQRRSVSTSLQAIGVLPLFDQVLSADDVVNCKPSPDIYLEAASRIGVAPARCLVFEDTEEGIQAATSAGAPYVDVREHATIYQA